MLSRLCCMTLSLDTPIVWNEEAVLMTIQQISLCRELRALGATQVQHLGDSPLEGLIADQIFQEHPVSRAQIDQLAI